MAKINPRDVFINADAFEIVCAILNERVHAGNRLILTHVMATNAALALELYLKTLLLLETGIYRRGHDLWKLFNYLAPETRLALENEHADYIGKRPEFSAAAARGNYPTDLKGLLILGRHTFPDFRYMHERMAARNPHKAAFGLNHFIFVVRERILKSNPNWESWIDDLAN